MWLIVGLGNPGLKYKNTWHNLGRMAVTDFAKKHDIDIKKHKFAGIYGEGSLYGEKLCLLLPETYMNNSGESVAAAKNFYHLENQNIIVLYDDVDINFGTLRIKESGSAGTHNGMKSVVNYLGYDFPRIRIGMGPRPQGDMVDIVLSSVPKAQSQMLQDMLDAASEAIEAILRGDMQKAQEKYNHKSH